MGNGDGTFAPQVVYPVDTGRYGPYAVQVDDFDKDGHGDLAITDFSHESVGLLLGNADGTFQGAVSYSAKGHPFDLVIADFDGDGNLDVATANNDNTVSVLLGNGDGTLQAPTTYPGEASPCSIGVGDFDGDGRPDLVTANRTGDSVSVLLNVSNQTTAVLASAKNPSMFGSKVRFSVTVTTVSGDQAEGDVVFKADDTMLGKVHLVDGRASIDSYALTVGSHIISVTFIWSSRFGGSNANLTQVVAPQ